MPSILFINRVYPPESGATGRVLEYVAHGFVSAGWDVSVLTTAGERSDAGEESRGGVKVIRIAMPFSKKSLLARAVGYALMIPSLLLKALMLPRADVVVTKTDPPMLLILGPFLKYLKGARTIHWAQDLYPEVAEEVGVFSKGGVVAGVIRSVSTHSMLACDAVVAVGRCMAKRLEGRGISQAKIRVVPNTGVEDDIVPVPRENNEFRKRHGLEGAFVIEYSGNLGRAHDFGTVLEAARLLEQRGETGILFLFVGSGPGEGLLRDEVARMGLKNIRFLPPQPAEFLSESLGAGDLHLVTMKSGMSGLVVPSKFYGVMAAGRPCLFVGPDESEVARVIREYGVGEVIAPGDADALFRAILRYRAAPQLTQDEGLKAPNVLGAGDASVALIRIATEILAPIMH
ncbi:MAG: glycosyltransferase family 4 protein [Chthoniobacterales bacterium]